METETLIKIITKEVLNRLNKQLPGNFSRERDNEDSILVISSEFSRNINSFLSYIKGNNPAHKLLLGSYESETNLNFVVKPELLYLPDKSIKRKIINQLNNYNKIYFLSPKLKLLKRIQDADDSGFVEWLVIHSLINNIDTRILTNISFSSPHNSFQKLLKDLLDKISKLGVKVENINNVVKGTIDDDKIDSNSTDKSLITKKEINDLWEEGRKMIRVKNKVITPLAIDRAREIGMEVVF